MKNIKYISYSTVIIIIITVIFSDIQIISKVALIPTFITLLLYIYSDYIQSIGFSDSREKEKLDTCVSNREIRNESIYTDKLFLGMVFTGFILTSCFYNYIINFLSILNLVIIYKVFIGFIFGYFMNIFRYTYISRNNQNIGKINNLFNKNGIIIFIVAILVIFIFVGFDLINIIYCQEDIVVTDSTNSNYNNDDKNYQFTISKSFVKDGFDSLFKVLSDSLPEIVGGIGGAKIAAASIKSAGSLPPLQRGLVGVLTGGAGALTLGLTGTAIKNIRKATDSGADDILVKIPRSYLEEIAKNYKGDDELVIKTVKKLVEFDKNINKTETGTNIGVETTTGVGGDGGNFIPSVLESYDNLSPLEILINCEILINIMILFYFFLIAIILIQKYNIKIFKISSVGLISKIFNMESIRKGGAADKINKFMEGIGNFSDKYLLLLLLINIFLILFCVLLNIYINIELSNNLDKFIQLHNQFKVK